MPKPLVLILTPLKDAAKNLELYFSLLEKISYPKKKISIAFLESDSSDTTYADIQARLPQLKKKYHKATLCKKDFGFRIPEGMPRYWETIQYERRSILARSRNQLLFRALQNEEWVLWLDSDLLEYPPDIIEQLLSKEKEILHPNCVLDYGGPSFDRNAWRDKGKLHMHDLRAENDVVPLDSVGGTMLWVKADIHRDGLIFPPFPYGLENPKIRYDNLWKGELETEGFAILASDMGYTCWGLPNLEIRHLRE
ncbi:MAG: Anp1 [Bacteroidetes bacterium]|nr:Anp1 [Bacteroidota bacterium]